MRKREVLVMKAIEEWFGDEKQGLNHASLSYTDYKTLKMIVWELMKE